jgi:hypothetical protein
MNNFSLLLGLSLSKQWIMFFTARYLVQPDDRSFLQRINKELSM